MIMLFITCYYVIILIVTNIGASHNVIRDWSSENISEEIFDNFIYNI